VTPLRRRMAIAIVALAGFFVSAYLLLYSLGYYGVLACGAGGGCDVVQASHYARFLGVPVAGWGTAWYATVFAVALVGVQPRFARARWPGRGLLLLAGLGLAFTGYLTYVELFVIHAICRWCVGSAVLTASIFLLALPWGAGSPGLAGEDSGGGPPEPLERLPVS